MKFETMGNPANPAILFFHAMGVTGASSTPVAEHLKSSYFCILPTSTVYCAGQTYVSKSDEVQQIARFLQAQGISSLALVVASSIGADLAMAFLTQTAFPVAHVFFDGGQFAQISKGTRRIMTPFLYLAIKSLYWSKGKTLGKIMWCDDDSIRPYFIAAGQGLTYRNLRRQLSDSLEDQPFPPLPPDLQAHTFFAFGSVEDHFKYRDHVKAAYPQGNFPIFEGMNHMQYQIRAPKDFAAMLISIITKTSCRSFPFSGLRRKERPMKYPIEKNTVQETLVIPLYGRKMCSELFPSLYRDETAIRLLQQVDYDFSLLEKQSQSTMQQFGFLEVAMRQNDLAWEVRDYLQTHPNAAVINLGCGLDNTGRDCDNGTCKLYNLDFPNVIEVRNALLPAGAREKNIPCDLNDTSWFQQIDASGGAVFFAAGVFYYFLRNQVQSLVQSMSKAFPGGRLVFDAAGKSAVKLMLKTWIKSAKIQDVGAYFSVSDAGKELSPWAKQLRVSSRGYMLGYQDLKGPSVKPFYRFLARVGDHAMKMQIVRLEFSEKG